MTTASDLINAGLRKLRIVDIDDTANSTQLANGLLALNALIDGWNAQEIPLYEQVELSAATMTGATSYTIGSSGTINTPWPSSIVSAYYRLSNVDYPKLKIVLKPEWDAIYGKTDAGIPDLLWYDMAFPLGAIHLWPNPASGSLLLTVEKQITEFAASSTTVTLPQGYRNALIYNFALEYSSEGGVLTDEIVGNAKMYLGMIKRRSRRRIAEIRNEAAYLGSNSYSNIIQGP